MAGKIVRMSKIKQLIRHYLSGASNREAARQLGLYKGTVNSYIQKIKSDNLSPDELLQLDDPVLETRLSAGNPAYLEERFEEFKELLPYFESELRRKHVNKKVLWDEYKIVHPSGYAYTQFCHHLKQQLIAGKPTAILKHHPGEKLFIDFAGDKLSYVDPQTGELIPVNVFVASLPYSDYGFAMAVPTQSTDDFLYALSCCLKALGGVPRIVVPDNLKAAVVKADRHEPSLNQAMDDLANHYGFVVIPARVRKPKDKALVENQVKLIYSRVYAKIRNQTFFSIEDLNAAIREKVREHNQTRMQQKPYSRQEKFLADEKQLLLPLPETDFELKYYADLRVAQNNCIYLGRDKHYYSVPFTYIGENVKVIYTRTLVKIYARGVLIATHIRSAKYGYTTERDHLCSAHKHYKDRSPEYYIHTAKARSLTLGKLIEALFEQTDIPEVLFKRCDGLLSLQRKTDPPLFERACAIDLDNKLYSYKFVKSVIENQAVGSVDKQAKALPNHANIRGKGYYH